MIDSVHQQFLKWASWVLQPVPGVVPAGYGKNILQRIIEGKGSLLPGAPKGSGLPRLYVPAEALVVEEYIKTIHSRDARVVRIFYLSPYWTVEERAWRLKLPVRTVYDRLDRIHKHFLAQQGSD